MGRHTKTRKIIVILKATATSSQVMIRHKIITIQIQYRKIVNKIQFGGEQKLKF